MSRPIYAINLTASGVEIYDLSGLYIDPYDTVDLSLFFSIDEIDQSEDLTNALESGLIVLNDGEQDLDLEDSYDLSTVPTFYDVPTRFLDLLDTPATYDGTTPDTRYLKISTTESGIEFTPINFVDLNDVPTYSGSAGQIPIVKDGEDGLDFISLDDILDSTINVKKNGVNVTGTPFSTLNFEGFDFVESTASGTVTISGCCEVAGDGDPADGALWGESNDQSSTNSESYQQKLRVTFTPEYAAYYEITSSCLYSHDDTGVFCFIRIQVDDSTTKKEMVRELYNFKKEDGAWSPYSSNFVIWLDATQHTIDMDYCQDDNPKTMYIKEAVITARRI